MFELKYFKILKLRTDFLKFFKKFFIRRFFFSRSFQEGLGFRGFSLLEVTIALCISGIMVGSFVSLMNSYTILEKVRKTQDHKEKILGALGLYFTEHGHLPCPGDPSSLGSDIGIMRRYCPGVLAQGIVPFRTLGLDEATAKDGYKRWFTYAIEPCNNYRDLFLLSSICNRFLSRDRIIGLRDQEVENIVNLLDPKDGIGVVLISHGQKGYGAFRGRGSLQRIQPPGHLKLSGCKRQNMIGLTQFCHRPPPEDKGFFDDQLFWVTRQHFLLFYTGIKLRCSEGKYDFSPALSSPKESNPKSSPVSR